MTGFSHFSTAEMHAWKVAMWRRSCVAMRAVSADWAVEGETLRGPGWVVAAVVSRPVVKARGPAPERMMARVVGEVERCSKIVRSSSHILC